MNEKRIVILGAGFGGITLAMKLSRKAHDITIIDRFNYHQFQPLFYQVASGRIEPSSISFPLRKNFQKRKNIHIRIAEIKSVDVQNKKVRTSIADYPYDILVLATGCTTNFFGNEEIARHAFPMKNTPEAVEVRNHILTNFERAFVADKDELKGIMNIVVVGGGPTGVELSGALAELKKNILPRDYPDKDFSQLQIHLIEGTDKVLGPMSEASHRKGKEYLEKLGVKVWLNSLVNSYDGREVVLKDGRTIRSNNLIWAAGVTGNLPDGFDLSLVQRGNRLKVDRFNQVEGIKDLYCIGDMAYMVEGDYQQGHPQVANVAINQARNLAKNLKKSTDKTEAWKPFVFKNPGSMATIGKHRAVVDLPFLSFQGRLAWFTWMFLHLMLILSVKNRVIIFFNWAISYFTNDTTLRLILRPTSRQLDNLIHKHQQEQRAETH